MCELGERLRQAREAKGLSLKQAAQRLALRAKVLEALEGCRFQELPEPALARGYLRRYALLLDLDPEPLLALYPDRRPDPPSPPPSRRSPWPWLLLILLLLLLGYGAYLLLRPEPEQVVTLPPEAPPEPPPRHALQVESQPPGARVYLDGFYLGQTPLASPPLEGGRRVVRLELPGYAPLEEEVVLDRDLALRYRLTPARAPEPPPPAQLVLRLEGRSWLRVTQGERRLYEGIPEVGSELRFDLPVEVRAGNPGAVRVFLGGEDLGPFGQPGIPLTRRFEAP